MSLFLCTKAQFYVAKKENPATTTLSPQAFQNKISFFSHFLKFLKPKYCESMTETNFYVF